MLVAAALVPDTALLVRGAGGRSDLLALERAAALDAVRAVTAAEPDRIVVVVGTVVPVGTGDRDGTWGRHAGTSLGAAGIPDDLLARQVTPVPARPRTPDDDAGADVAGPAGGSVAGVVALRLLAETGWTGAVEVTSTAGASAELLRARGRDVVLVDRVGLVLVGSLSARNGPEAPLAHDTRAGGFDDATVTALVAPDAQGAGWLASVPGPLADELAVSAWGPWQALLGAAHGGTGLRGTLHSRTAPFGATYAVVSWVLDGQAA